MLRLKLNHVSKSGHSKKLPVNSAQWHATTVQLYYFWDESDYCLVFHKHYMNIIEIDWKLSKLLFYQVRMFNFCNQDLCHACKLRCGLCFLITKLKWRNILDRSKQSTFSDTNSTLKLSHGIWPCQPVNKLRFVNDIHSMAVDAVRAGSPNVELACFIPTFESLYSSWFHS